MILGNLYREKGQVGRAITVHQALLQRPADAARARVRAALPRPRLQARRLRRSRARGVQRSAAARSREPLRAVNLAEAARRAASVERGLRHAAAAGDSSSRHRIAGRRTRRSSRSSRTRSASRRCGAGTTAEAARRFEAAIDLDARAVPAYLNLGDVRVRRGRRRATPIAIWERLIDVAPDRAYLAFDRLEALAYPHRRRRSGSPRCAAG